MIKKLSLIILLLFLISCTPLEDTQGDTMTDEKPFAENIIDNQPLKEEDLVKENKVLDPKIQELIDKAKAVNNYQYFFESSVRDIHDNLITATPYNIYIRDNKMTKVYNSPKRDGELFYNRVYFDLSETMAVAECETKSVTCDGIRQKILPVDYTKEFPEFLPHMLIDQIPAYAEISDGQTIGTRQTYLVKYDNKELSLDKFSGLAVQLEVLEDGKVKEKHSFNKLGLNTVTSEEINPPNYPLLE